MSEIRILDFTPSHNLGHVIVSIKIATIDDTNGNTIVSPYEVDRGELNIQSLIDRNKEIIDAFHSRTSNQQYFGRKPTIDMSHPQVNLGFEEVQEELAQSVLGFRNLLDRSLQENFWNQIREKIIISLNNNYSQQIRLVIRTDLKDIQDIPVESASFITKVLTEQNPSSNVNVVFAPKVISQKISQAKLIWDGTPKILLVIGNQHEIADPIKADELKKFFLSPAIITTLLQPSWEELRRTIANSKFDGIILLGHSRCDAKGTDGSITINNQEDRVSIKDFTAPFKNSIANGLKVVILGGCSSIGLARALTAPDIGVASVISCRMPVHYKALRLLFEELLTRWTNQDKPTSLESALTETRRELTALDTKYPGSSLLPILLTTLPDAPPLMFPVENIDVPPPPKPWWKIFKQKAHILWEKSLAPITYQGIDLKVPPIALIGIAAAIAASFATRPQQLEPSCNSNLNDEISCGEEIFNKEREVAVQESKQAGANAIATGNYSRAIELLIRAWEAKKDPETLIMLENSKIKTQNLPIKTIALTIPASGSTPLDIPNSILKAVGYAQQQWNANSSRTWNLQIVLVDDRNNQATAPQLASNLLKRQILAGIGSYSSAVTIPVKKIYEQQQTVLISGTSTASTLANPNSNTFFFRICASNKVSGKQIADYLKAHKYSKIAIFHTSGQPFSDSMTEALRENSMGAVSIVKDFDFKGEGLAIDKIKEAKQAGAQAIVLIPDAYTSDNPERSRLLSIIRENNGDLPIIGNELVKDATLFNYSKQQIEKVVINLPWHPSSDQQNKAIKIPAFWGDENQLDHRLAMNYDAAQALIKVLDTLPVNQSINDSRLQIQKTLSNPTFSISGITGNIGFNGSERRSQPSNSLVTPKCDDKKCNGFKPAI